MPWCRNRRRDGRCGRRRDQPRVDRALEDAKAARRVLRRARIHPRRDAARRDLRIPMRSVHARVERPPLGAGCGIERDQLVERRGEIEHPINQNGRRFEGSLLVQIGRRGERAGVIRPRDAQRTDVLARDLRQRGIARATRIAAVGAPPTVVGHKGQWCEQQQGECALHERSMTRRTNGKRAFVITEGQPAANRHVTGCAGLHVPAHRESWAVEGRAEVSGRRSGRN